MSLSQKIAMSLYPNEAARLRCQLTCPDAKQCVGTEGLMLEKLRLLQITDDGCTPTELGLQVSKQVAYVDDKVAAPILKM